MHNHYHNHCDHNLKHCGHCDVVYCTKCGREWGHNYGWYTTSTYPYYSILGNATSGGSTVTGCSHKDDVVKL